MACAAPILHMLCSDAFDATVSYSVTICLVGTRMYYRGHRAFLGNVCKIIHHTNPQYVHCCLIAELFLNGCCVCFSITLTSPQILRFSNSPIVGFSISQTLSLSRSCFFEFSHFELPSLTSFRLSASRILAKSATFPRPLSRATQVPQPSQRTLPTFPAFPTTSPTNKNKHTN